MAAGKKTGGRVAGTPNKATSIVRAAITDLLEEYFSPNGEFKTDMAELEPKDRVAAMEKLAAFAVPKLQATTLDVMASEKKKTIEDQLAQLSVNNNK